MKLTEGKSELNEAQSAVLTVDRLPSTFVVSRGGEAGDPNEAFAVNYLNLLFKMCLDEKVSDLHFESMEHGNICRLRRDSHMTHYGTVLSDLQFSAIREKLYARGRIEESYAKNHAVDARGWLRFDTRRVDLRISCVPTTHGFSIVIRLLDQANSGKNINDIEMPELVRGAFLDMVKAPHGLLLITGPTGSGKTTTLYSLLNSVNDISNKIITIENPVEYTIPNVQHVNVSNHLSFNQALRAALRQDPDIILVGEIRDSETAKTAVEAAQTGHLVLSTLHANSSVGAISRLLELGVDSSHINETLLGVCAQRLVRKCRDQRDVEEPTQEEKAWLRKNGFSNYTQSFFGRGISKELYKGRIPVIELMLMTDEIRQRITFNDIPAIHALVEKQKQFETLTSASVRLASEGKTSLVEAISISSTAADTSFEGLLLGERLVAMNFLTDFQYEYAKEVQRNLPKISKKTLKDVILDLHFCSYEQLQEVGDAPDA